jgi:hypothetical protein
MTDFVDGIRSIRNEMAELYRGAACHEGGWAISASALLAYIRDIDKELAALPKPESASDPTKLSNRQKDCLKVFAEAVQYPDQCILFYTHITTDTGLHLTQARHAVRALARKGLVKRGACFNDDGFIQGSGYYCTDAGLALHKKLSGDGDEADCRAMANCTGSEAQ